MRPTDNFCHGCSDQRHQRAMANILTRASCLAISISLSLSPFQSIATQQSTESAVHGLWARKSFRPTLVGICVWARILRTLWLESDRRFCFCLCGQQQKKNRKGEKGEKTQQQATTTTSDNNSNNSNYNNGDNNKGKQQGWHKLSAHFLCIFKCPYILPLWV